MTTNPGTTLAIWHGYLLGATGSNIYSRHLIRAWVRAGHDVVLACQESHPDQFAEIHDVVRLVHDEETGSVTAERRAIREPEPGHGRCTMVVPDIHGLLPVYVMDRYAGFEVVRLVDATPEQRARYARDQAAAITWVLDNFAPDGVLINHATPLPAALQPVLEARGVPYAVKVHGSELEYALVEDPSLAPAAAHALTGAAAVLVGSGHIERRTAELLGASCLEGRVVTIPPGVDLTDFQPLPEGGRAAGHAALVASLLARGAQQAAGRTLDTSARIVELVAGPAADLVDGLIALQGTYQERHVEASAVAELERLDLVADEPSIVFVGKLIPQKGVHLLLAALPQVLAAHPTARIVIAGFGPLRDGLEALLVAMQSGNEAALDALAADMGRLSGEGGSALLHLAAWLDELRQLGELATWLATCAEVRVAERVAWLGLVDHEILAELWPLASTSVVPSILAEAFGMVAAEAATCGCVPIVSDHSGLADAAAVIERGGVTPVRFPLEGEPSDAVPALAAALNARLSLTAEEAHRQALAARANVAAEWGWDQLAALVVERMTGRHAG
ncbi:MAG: glycosyl transferase group 1 [Thermoleophilia bacterium]|nr:glycosyl transferase group 1 [Thermoleophilia bacterium]